MEAALDNHRPSQLLQPQQGEQEACGGSEEGPDASIRRGQGVPTTTQQQQHQQQQHTVGTRRRQHTGSKCGAPAPPSAPASASAPCLPPSAAHKNPAEDESVPIALPRELLRRVLNSLFDSGLDGQQALACDLAMAVNAELQRMAARARAEEAAASLHKAVAAAAVALRRRTVSSLATTVTPTEAAAEPLSASSSSSLASVSTTAPGGAGASAVGASSAITAAAKRAVVAPSVAPSAPASPSSLSASSAVGTDAFLSSGGNSSASEGEDEEGESAGEDEEEEDEDGVDGRQRAFSSQRREWQQRRGGGRRARRRGVSGARERAEAREAAAWTDVAALEAAATADAEAAARRRGMKPAGQVEPLRIEVVGTEVARDPLNGRDFVQYVLRVSQGERAREVRRRFSDVLDFDATLSFESGYDGELGALAPQRPWFSLSLGSSLDPKLTQERAAAIGRYMTAVLARKALRAHPVVQQFLGFSLKSPALACCPPSSPLGLAAF